MASVVRIRGFFSLILLSVRSAQNVTPLRVVCWVVLTALALLDGIFVPAAVAQTCPSNVPHIQGAWRTLPYLMPINPISATMLNTGRVLIVAGSENDAKNNSVGAESYRNAVWIRPAQPRAASQFRTSTTTYSAAAQPPCRTVVRW